MASKITLEWIILPSHALKVAPNRIVLRFQLYLLCHTAALLPRAQKCTPKNSLPVFDNRASLRNRRHIWHLPHTGHTCWREVCVFLLSKLVRFTRLRHFTEGMTWTMSFLEFKSSKTNVPGTACICMYLCTFHYWKLCWIIQTFCFSMVLTRRHVFLSAGCAINRGFLQKVYDYDIYEYYLFSSRRLWQFTG